MFGDRRLCDGHLAAARRDAADRARSASADAEAARRADLRAAAAALTPVAAAHQIFLTKLGRWDDREPAATRLLDLTIEEFTAAVVGAYRQADIPPHQTSTYKGSKRGVIGGIRYRRGLLPPRWKVDGSPGLELGVDGTWWDCVGGGGEGYQSWSGAWQPTELTEGARELMVGRNLGGR